MHHVSLNTSVLLFHLMKYIPGMTQETAFVSMEDVFFKGLVLIFQANDKCFEVIN